MDTRLRVGLSDRIAIAGIVCGFAGTVAAMALPLAYPDLEPWVWRLIFWPSVASMIGAIVFLIYDLVIRPRSSLALIDRQIRRSERIVITLVFLLAVFSGGAWYVSRLHPASRAVASIPIPMPNPRPDEASRPLGKEKFIQSDIKLFAQCDTAGQPIPFGANGKIYSIQLNPVPAPYGIGFSTHTGTSGAMLNLSNPGDPILTVYKCEFINYHTEPLFKVSVPFHIIFSEALADKNSVSSFHNGAITLDRDGIIEIPKIDIGKDVPFILYMWNMTSQFVTVMLPSSVSLSDGKLVPLIQPQSWGMHFPPNQNIASKN